MTMSTKTTMIQLRVSPAEKRTLKARAKEAGLPLSAWMRMVLLKKAIGVLLVVGLMTACGSNPARPTMAPAIQPSSPVSSTGPFRLGLGGQSNADHIRPFLAEIAAVNVVSVAGSPIACWSLAGTCWPGLKAQLAQPLEAFVWSHGEADISLQIPPNAPAPGYYGAALANLMARIRHENRNPKLLIVITEMGQLPAIYTARHQLTVEAETLAWIQQDQHAIFVPTRDLEWRLDALHRTDQGNRDAAKRIVDAIQETLGR